MIIIRKPKVCSLQNKTFLFKNSHPTYLIQQYLPTSTFFTQRLALWALNHNIPGSNPGITNIRNDFFYGSVLDNRSSAPESFTLVLPDTSIVWDHVIKVTIQCNIVVIMVQNHNWHKTKSRSFLKSCRIIRHPINSKTNRVRDIFTGRSKKVLLTQYDALIRGGMSLPAWVAWEWNGRIPNCMDLENLWKGHGLYLLFPQTNTTSHVFKRV